MFIVFIFLGVMSVFFVSFLAKESVSKIFSNGEVQAVLIVALPTLVIWNIDTSARRNEDFNSITESTLKLRESFEKRFSEVEVEIKKIISDEMSEDLNGSRLIKILSTLAGDLDYLEDLLNSRNEVLFQRMYLIEIFRLLSMLEQRGDEKNGELIVDRISYAKTKILSYYLSIVSKRPDFGGDVITSLFISLNEEGNSEAIENGEKEYVLRNIDFSHLPISDKISPIKEEITYLKFINCIINIDTIKFLIRENGRTVEFKKCKIERKGLTSKKLVLDRNDLQELLSVSEVIIN